MRGGLVGKTSWGHSGWLLAAVALATSCSLFSGKNNSDDDDDGGDSGQSGETATGGTGQGGSTGKGGSTSKGGGTSNGGSVSQGGGSARGGSSNGGSVADGGTFALGGDTSLGGTVAHGGSGGDLLVGGSGGDIGIGGSVSNGGSGGSVSNGGSGGNGGGEPPSGECGSAFNVESGGYVTSPGSTCFKGYAFTAIDSFGTTITPESFEACASPSCLCASGTVIGDLDYLSYASFGFNVNQAPELDAAEGTVAPQGTGLTVSYVNTGSSDLRVQIASGDTRWCYEPLVGTSGVATIPYTSFNTECWVGGSGTYFTPGTPITSIQLVMPSKQTDVPFNVCLVSAKDSP